MIFTWHPLDTLLKRFETIYIMIFYDLWMPLWGLENMFHIIYHIHSNTF